MPAASSSIWRRSAGLAWMIAPIRPWLTSAGECAPVAAEKAAQHLAGAARPGLEPQIPRCQQWAAVEHGLERQGGAPRLVAQLVAATMRDDGHMAGMHGKPVARGVPDPALAFEHQVEGNDVAGAGRQQGSELRQQGFARHAPGALDLELKDQCPGQAHQGQYVG